MQAHEFRHDAVGSTRPSILFFEDFEPPGASLAPAPAPPPAITADDLAAARAAAFADGYQQGLAEARAGSAEAASRALQALAEALQAADATLAALVEARAEDIVRLVLGTVGTLFPALCARFGPSEAAAMAVALQPGLRDESVVNVRVNPQSGAAMAEAILAALRDVDPELCARMRFVEAASVLPGDVRIEWERGGARRDSSALWAAVAGILSPLDLLNPAAVHTAVAA